MGWQVVGRLKAVYLNNDIQFWDKAKQRGLRKGLGKTWKRLGKRLGRRTWIVSENTWKKDLEKLEKRLGKDLEEDLERLRKGLYLGKTRKRIGKRPGKTWKITLPVKYIEIANSNSFYAQ